MQPPHMSCPSSSHSALASSYVQKYVHSALSAAGFSKSSAQAVELLSEVFERYLLLLGSSTQQKAAHARRTLPCAWDAEVALRSLGSSAEDVQRWALDDGMDLAGQWDIRNVSEQRGQDDEDLDDGVRLLERHLRFAKGPKQRPLQLLYEDVTPEQALEMTQLEGRDDLDTDSDEADNVSQDLASTSEVQTPPPPYDGSPKVKRKRSMSPDTIFPPFLPAWPGTHDGNGVHTLDDAEHEREKTLRRTQGEMKTEAATLPGVEAAKAAVVEPVTNNLPKRSTEELWQRAIGFLDSELAAVHSADDLPAIEESIVSSRPSGASSEQASSSMRAFANDYPALVKEAIGSEPALLTPSGSQYARAFHQRRALAAFLADSSKYVPCDTVFGGISARPTALPFQPTSSMLITPPTAEHSAPTFTPLRPNGRELPSATWQSHALYPSCRHRIPGNVLNAARLVSGGVATETYRRMTRIHDPEPILDEHHAERVFHGQPAPKELLVEGNSVLKGALDTLKVKRAEERAAARESMGLSEFELGESGELDENGKPTGQLSMSATRDRIKVKNGTIVSTWDWMSRDFADPILPGKKFKAATPGITLGGGGGGDVSTGDDSINRSHQRRASIAGELSARQRERSASRTR